MSHTILVPLDQSAWSEHALPVAGMLARASGATVDLVHVFVPLVMVDVGGFGLGAIPVVDPTWYNERMADAETYINTQAQKLSQGWNVPTTTHILDGTIVETLAAHIHSEHPELVVMTTHGRGGLARLWLGSVADRLIHHSTSPILFVRPHDHVEQEQTPKPLKQILVPLDGSSLSEQILAPTMLVGQPMQASYTLVRIVEPLVMYGYSPIGYAADIAGEATQALQEEAQTYLDQVAARWAQEGITVTTRVIVAEHTATALLKDAQEHNVDLIAMATHGRGGLARMVIGSVADKVLRGAECPVLLYRPREESSRSSVVGSQ